MANEVLVDTHYLLWFLTGSVKVNQRALDLLVNPKNTIYYSIASMWEVEIKHKINKMPISGIEFMHYCEQAGFKKLPMDDRHVAALESLEQKENAPVHKDPFDRMLLAQAKADCMMLLTHDNKFSSYDEPYIMKI